VNTAPAATTTKTATTSPPGTKPPRVPPKVAPLNTAPNRNHVTNTSKKPLDSQSGGVKVTSTPSSSEQKKTDSSRDHRSSH
jgi:hypothetical protein